jgi:hypothetical protein
MLPLPLCRSWLFVGGAEESALAAVPGDGHALDVPTLRNAQVLLDRAAALGVG